MTRGARIALGTVGIVVTAGAVVWLFVLRPSVGGIAPWAVLAAGIFLFVLSRMRRPA